MNNREQSELSQQVAALSKQMAFLVERQKARDELIDEMQPVIRAVLDTATGKLQGMEDRGHFAFLRESMRVIDRVVEAYGEDDVRQLGDNIVSIMDTVRNLTQPHVLALAKEATDVIDNADKIKPTGVMGMVKASRDEDVQRGMAVMLDVLRHVGRGVKDLSKNGSRRALPPPRKRASSAVAPKHAAAKTAAKTAAPSPAASAPAPVLIDGVAFDDGGFMVDASQWNREIALAIAASLGITELSDGHWKALEAARKDYLETGQSPNIRRLTKVGGVTTKEIYTLFPKAPGLTIARVAGCAKPVGCI